MYVQNQESVVTSDPEIWRCNLQKSSQTEEDSKVRHNSKRERRVPQYWKDYIMNADDDSDLALINNDYC